MLKNPDVIRRIRRADCLQYDEFDSKYNIDTKGTLAPTADGSGAMRPGGIANSIPIVGSNEYEASALEYVDMVNEELSKQPGIENCTFIDIGSGKGRVLFYNLIKDAPYKDYAGVEADPVFHDIAVKNLSTFNLPITKDVNFINVNALDYVVENKDCVYYFYFPFQKTIFDQFMNKNWEIIRNTNSYLVFLFEDTYDVRRYLDKAPIYDYAELVIYKVHD